MHDFVQSVTPKLMGSVPMRLQSIAPQPVLLQPVSKSPPTHVKGACGTSLVSTMLIERFQNNGLFSIAARSVSPSGGGIDGLLGADSGLRKSGKSSTEISFFLASTTTLSIVFSS